MRTIKQLTVIIVCASFLIWVLEWTIGYINNRTFNKCMIEKQRSSRYFNDDVDCEKVLKEWWK